MSSPHTWDFCPPEALWADLGDATVSVLGSRPRLLAEDTLAQLPAGLRPLFVGLLSRMPPTDHTQHTSLWFGDRPSCVHIAVLPDQASRHNAPSRPYELTSALRRHAESVTGELRVLVVGRDEEDAFTLTGAVTRALPAYSRRAGAPSPNGVRVAFAFPNPVPDGTWQTAAILRDAVASAMFWHDTPCSDLGVEELIELARECGQAVGATVRVVRGDALLAEGLRGIWEVGRAATSAPALVWLTREPPRVEGTPARKVVWVGKGVVFDTGGLSLKRPAEMRHMKGDMAGAAAVLAAFCAAVRLGAPDHLSAVLCIADNAVGPRALRPDDIVELHSGRTVEITDTDCEGRLLLADGVSYALQTLKPDVIVDLATLTDAAPMATGLQHAAVVCSDGDFERRVTEAGRAIGELVHPMPYVPELSRPLLRSEVADLRNSALNDRLGVSTAAQFVAESLAGFSRPWLHVDMEGTARTAQGRATGFGVGLLLKTFGYL